MVPTGKMTFSSNPNLTLGIRQNLDREGSCLGMGNSVSCQKGSRIEEKDFRALVGMVSWVLLVINSHPTLPSEGPKHLPASG